MVKKNIVLKETEGKVPAVSAAEKKKTAVDRKGVHIQ